MSIAALTRRLGAPEVPPVPSPKLPDGTGEPFSNQAGSPGSPGSPEKRIGQSVSPTPLTPADLEAIAERIEERAAIQEHDAHLPRTVAEQEAQTAPCVYSVRVAMGAGEPDRWVTMLAPHCDLAQATRAAQGQFGAARVRSVVEQERRQ